MKTYTIKHVGISVNNVPTANYPENLVVTDLEATRRQVLAQAEANYKRHDDDVVAIDFVILEE